MDDFKYPISSAIVLQIIDMIDTRSILDVDDDKYHILGTLALHVLGKDEMWRIHDVDNIESDFSGPSEFAIIV